MACEGCDDKKSKISFAMELAPAPLIHDGELLAVLICDLCGQPLAPGTFCESGVHFGPPGKEQLVGSPVPSTKLAAERLAMLREFASGAREDL